MFQSDTRVVVLTGAGISAESGIRTFRANDGVWENHRIEDVATPFAWERDPKLVWGFYQGRRRQLLDVVPNCAHQALVSLENYLDEFLLITQNVDDLHSRAGSKKLIHIHGELRKLRCETCGQVIDAMNDEHLQNQYVECTQCTNKRLRPHIVWFHEMPFRMEEIYDAVVDNSPKGVIELFHGYTYSGIPISVAAALAVQDIFEKEDIFKRAKELAPYFQEGLFSLKDIDVVENIRGYGMMGGIDIKMDTKPGRAGLATFKHCYDAGVNFKATGDCLIIAPMFICEKKHIDEIIEKLRTGITNYSKSKKN